MEMQKNFAGFVLAGILMFFPAVVLGQPADEISNAALLQRIEQMEQELSLLKAQLKQATSQAETANQNAANAVKKAETATKEAKTAKSEAVKVAKSTNDNRNSDAKWHLAGYGDAGLIISDGAGPDTFTSGQFNPVFHFQYRDLVMFEGELEFSTTSEGETNVELEYSQFDLLLHDNATLVIGKYLSPVGQFQERLHPSWINKIADKPAGFDHDGLQPASDTGVQLRGGILIGDSVLTYALAVGNGPRMALEGGINLEASGSDDNGNKAVSGRIGFLPVHGIEIGASFLTAKVNGIDGPMGPGPTNADFFLWGADAAFTRGPWDARFEYLNGERKSLLSAVDAGGDVMLLPTLDMEAWYAQLAYRLSGVTDHPVLRKLEPVVRFGQYNIVGSNTLRMENAQDRYNIGLNFWLAPSIVAKGGVEWRDFKVSGIDTETLYQFQFAYGF